MSQNKIKSLGDQLATLSDLKSLNLDQNALEPGSIAPISKLSKLQTLSAGSNKLGSLPPLPVSLKQLKLNACAFSNFPMQIVLATKLEKLDLSNNNMAAIPTEISNLLALTDLNLDNNVIVALPASIGKLKKLKTLSLKNNKVRVSNTNFSAQNPQPLPPSLFRDTLVVDLNLHGNPMTSTQLNDFEGFDSFLERRAKIKSKDIYGGAMTNLDVTGLK